ncbi:MAG: agmatinase [Bacillota bacterium]
MNKNTPWDEIGRTAPAQSDLIILGVPFDGAVSASRGAAAAPDRLRELSRILPPFSEEGKDLRHLKLADQGNVALTLRWERFFDEVERQAATALQTGRFCLFLGGDHSVTIPLIKAFASYHSAVPVGIIHFDSHCDLMDEYDGHPWSHACTQRRSLEQPNILPDHLALVGIRSYEAAELEFIRANPAITVIGARKLYCQGLPKTLDQICSAMAGAAVVYLSLDIDVLDPAFAPGTGTPEGGGLSTREVIELIRALLTRLPVKAADIVEVSPPLDCSDITSWAALKIIYEIFAVLATR